jgi:hypothetical protein
MNMRAVIAPVTAKAAYVQSECPLYFPTNTPNPAVTPSAEKAHIHDDRTSSSDRFRCVRFRCDISDEPINPFGCSTREWYVEQETATSFRRSRIHSSYRRDFGSICQSRPKSGELFHRDLLRGGADPDVDEHRNRSPICDTSGRSAPTNRCPQAGGSASTW